MLCGHVLDPWEYHDQLPDGRALRVVRAGSRAKDRGGYAVVTRRAGGWDVEWGEAELTPRTR